MQTHLNEPFAKREGYQEVSFRYRFCSPIERVAQVMEERCIHIYNDTEKQSIDNEISRKMLCDSLIYRFNSSHGISHSPNLPSDTELMASSINRP
ncbi:hypothetical protein CLI79_04425 [Porphyromonas gingivalis]|nr:hypothetical protein CLI79_04425 [Porphyromonas gingivalis]